MSKSRHRRDTLDSLLKPIATPRVHAATSLPRVTYTTNKFALSLIEDRRTHYPGLKPYNRPVAAFSVNKPARLKLIEPIGANKFRPSAQTKATIAFQDPKSLPLCTRRAVRKEVLHAKGVAGSKVRKPKRNEWSDVSCRS